MERACRLARGRIRLARGDLPAALEDADKQLALARMATDPQVLVPALAFRARVALMTGDRDQAGAYASELLAMLAEQAELTEAPNGQSTCRLSWWRSNAEATYESSLPGRPLRRPGWRPPQRLRLPGLEPRASSAGWAITLCGPAFLLVTRDRTARGNRIIGLGVEDEFSGSVRGTKKEVRSFQ